MKQIPIIVFIHAAAFLGIASILHVLQANSSLSGWIFPAAEAGAITFFGGAIVQLFPRFLPKQFFAVTHSTKESFETHSWFGSVNAVLTFGIFFVAFAVSVLVSPGTVLLSRHSGSLVMSALFPIFMLALSANQLLQIIGDGTSGIRIYPDHIEIRKIGRYGWSFKKDDIEKVEVLDDIFPLVAVDGQGKEQIDSGAPSSPTQEPEK